MPIRWTVPTVIISVSVHALVSLGMSAAVWAEDEDETDEGSQEVSTVVVETVERPTLQRDDRRFGSAMTTRVDTSDLAFWGRGLAEALEGVGGVGVQRSSSAGQPAWLSVRGGNPRQVAVELDGLRLNAPVGTGMDVGQMMTGGLSSADMMRGSAAAIHGGGASTGALRLNPAEAGGEGIEIRGHGSAGSFGSAAVGSSISVGDESMGLRLYGGLRQSEGDFDFVDDQGRERERINNHHRRLSTGGTAHVERGGHRLRLTGLWEEGEGGSPGPSEFQESYDGASVEDHRRLMTLRWEGQGLYEEGSRALDAYATAGVQDRRHHHRNEESFLGGELSEQDSREQTAAVTGGLEGLWGSHLLRLDVEGRIEDYQGRQDNGFEGPSTLEARRHTVSASVADEWLVAGERLSLLGALRMEATLGDGEARNQLYPLVPAAGAIGHLHRALELRANLARTFREPHFDELYLETDAVRGNPDLEAEEGWHGDVGLRVGSDEDRAVIQGAYFYRHIDSTILFLPASAYHFEAQNLRDARAQGAEIQAHVAPWERLQVGLNYTYTRAGFRGEGNSNAQLPGRPRHRYGVEPRVDLGTISERGGGVEMGLHGRLTGRSTVNLDNFGQLQNRRAATVDMGVEFDVGETMRVAGAVRNILDHRRAQDSLHRPLPGRSLFVSMEMRHGY